MILVAGECSLLYFRHRRFLNKNFSCIYDGSCCWVKVTEALWHWRLDLISCWPQWNLMQFQVEKVDPCYAYSRHTWSRNSKAVSKIFSNSPSLSRTRTRKNSSNGGNDWFCPIFLPCSSVLVFPQLTSEWTPGPKNLNMPVTWKPGIFLIIRTNASKSEPWHFKILL